MRFMKHYLDKQKVTEKCFEAIWNGNEQPIMAERIKKILFTSPTHPPVMGRELNMSKILTGHFSNNLLFNRQQQLESFFYAVTSWELIIIKKSERKKKLHLHMMLIVGRVGGRSCSFNLLNGW